MSANRRCSTGWRGKRLAIVDDTPGVTRDRVAAESNFGGLASAHPIDTAGFERRAAESLQARMLQQTRAAPSPSADVCLFVIDAREGVTPGDEIVADALRKSGKPVILAANKCEGAAAMPGQAEALCAGLRRADRAFRRAWIGLADLYDALAPFAASEIPRKAEPAEPEADRPLQARHRRPAQCRQVEPVEPPAGRRTRADGPEAGITRDAVAAAMALAGAQHPAARHRGPAQKARTIGRKAGKAVRRFDAQRHPLRRLRDRGDRCDAALREAGPRPSPI